MVGLFWANQFAPSPAYELRPFLYKDGAVYEVGTLSGQTTRALGINDGDDVVSTSLADDGRYHADVPPRGRDEL